MKVAIVNIGNELLKGLTLNSNLTWLSNELDSIGLEVVLGLSTRDDMDEIENYLKIAFKDADIIITTGGLGPTADDITREAIIKTFNLKSENNEKLIEYQKKHYGHVFEKMTQVPIGAMVIMPEFGSAGGWQLSIENKLLFVLPGVPDEMKSMVTSHIIPFLKSEIINNRQTQVLRFFDIKEVVLEDTVKNFKNISYGLLPKKGSVDVYLQAKAKDKNEAAQLLKEPADILREKFKNNYLGERDSTFENEIYRHLSKNARTLSCAESITGGLIANKITNIAGSSNYFLGSVTAYSNEAKTFLLGVNKETLDKYGAVSAKVAQEMAKGAMKRFSSDYAISSTGIAGPDGGSKEKAIGLNYVAVATKTGTESTELNLAGSRLSIKDQVANQALALLYKKLI